MHLLSFNWLIELDADHSTDDGRPSDADVASCGDDAVFHVAMAIERAARDGQIDALTWTTAGPTDECWATAAGVFLLTLDHDSDKRGVVFHLHKRAVGCALGGVAEEACRIVIRAGDPAQGYPQT